MSVTATASLADEGSPPCPGDWSLLLAMDSQAVADPPSAVSLAGVTEVTIHRGSARRTGLDGAHLFLELPDRWVSQPQARLVRSDDHWTIEDDRSRNGTRVNGELVTRRVLWDGDVLQCGGTVLVLRRVDRAVDLHELLEQPEPLRTLNPDLGRELDLLRKVARSTIPVLVLGESGAGKEGIVQALHGLSGRDGPLVAVNCGAIPPTLVESEFFGSRRGAFSGAEDRTGLLGGAANGTLFLDEVSELPLSSQAALLRFLQEREFVPLGASRPMKLDVRVVAATNRPVAELVEHGKLRGDLYARLKGFEVHLPPLRERLEDLGLLVATLIARHDRSGRRWTLSPTAASALFAHDWPRNVRELEQAISAAITIADGEIGLEHLSQPIRDAGAWSRANSAMERDSLVALVRRCEGNVSAVARALGTSRSRVYRLLERLSITL